MLRAMPDLNKWGPATVLVVALVVIVTVAGAVVAIVHPDSLSFRDYLTLLAGAAASSGLLGIGRGIHAAAQPDIDSGPTALATSAPVADKPVAPDLGDPGSA